jgi:biotin carboxylase
MPRTPEEIIDELIRARAVNNEHWGSLIRLAWEAAPDRAREISQRINAQDRVVVGLAEELAKEPEPSKTKTKPAVLIPGGGVLHTYAVREALALGLTPIVTDRDPNCPCAKIPGVGFYVIDCYDMDAHLRLIREPGADFIGAFCAGAETHVVVAAVHEAMGWSGRWVSRATAETCRDKRAQKAALECAGVPTAMEVPPAAAPYICKPRSGSGSRGVKRFLARSSGACPNGEDGLHEELLEGPEQSVEILLHNQTTSTWINIVDRHFRWVDDQPLEYGHTNPTQIGEKETQALYRLACEAARAVGADVGFFKCDTIWTKDGPKVLECTPRLSGGFDSQVSTPRSSGRNLIRYGLQLACGLPTDSTLLTTTKTETITVIHRPELAWDLK